MSAFFAVLTGLGVGSGGLFVLWLRFAEGMNQAEAQGVNLLFFSLCILSSTLVNLRFSRVVVSALLPLVFFGLLTSLPASFLAKSVDAALLSRLFGAFLVAAGSAGLK